MRYPSKTRRTDHFLVNSRRFDSSGWFQERNNAFCDKERDNTMSDLKKMVNKSLPFMTIKGFFEPEEITNMIINKLSEINHKLSKARRLDKNRDSVSRDVYNHVKAMQEIGEDEILFTRMEGGKMIVRNQKTDIAEILTYRRMGHLYTVIGVARGCVSSIRRVYDENRRRVLTEKESTYFVLVARGLKDDAKKLQWNHIIFKDEIDDKIDHNSLRNHSVYNGKSWFK